MTPRPDPSVSPADTIRPCIAHVGHPTTRSYPEICDGCKADAALDALLAVGERDKAEIERLEYQRNDALRRIGDWQAIAKDLREQGERDRQHIRDLTEALERIVWTDKNAPREGELAEIARAALVPFPLIAGEEDTP